MKHLGDITKIDGHNVPIVDVITGGSPCQDLSVAGKRAGLAGERSGLFMEQIRIVKEMRDESRKTDRGADKYVRPRYMVWENVVGALFSNKGDDFRAVLEETARIADPAAVIPRPPQGKWRNAVVIVGDGWSIACRVHDAQFWGVPQRRRRISLVADFGGGTAPEILFEREGVSGDIEQSGAQGQGAAGETERDSDCAGECLTAWDYQSKRVFSPDGVCATLNSGENSGSIHPSVLCMDAYKHHEYRENEVCGVLTAGQNNAVRGDTPLIVENYGKDARYKMLDGVAPTVTAVYGTGGNNTPFVIEGNGTRDSHRGDGYSESETMYTLNTVEKHGVAYGLDRAAYNQGANASFGFCVEEEKIGAQVAKGPGAVFSQYIVRRLTPIECERLQGFPDGWTDIGEWTDGKGKKRKPADAPRYKALGNSIALPFWEWMAKRMRAYLGDAPTMASLFDGIGGFALVYSRAGVNPVWASEVDEFPMAVTKRRFPDDY